MGGFTRRLYSAVETVTATVAVPTAEVGGHAAASFIWDVAAITGTWDIAIYFDIGGSRIKVAELTGITTTGLKRIPLTADFNFTRAAVPSPTSITFTEAVAGTLTSTGYVIYGD